MSIHASIRYDTLSLSTTKPNEMKLQLLSFLIAAIGMLPAAYGQKIEAPCMEGLLKVLKTSPRIQQVEKDLTSVGVTPSYLVGEVLRPKGVRNTAYSEKITIRIGIDHPERFEPVTTVVLYPASGRLVEIDWLTGEEIPLEFDTQMLQLLPQICGQ